MKGGGGRTDEGGRGPRSSAAAPRPEPAAPRCDGAEECGGDEDSGRPAAVRSLLALEGGFLKEPAVLRAVWCDGHVFTGLHKSCRTLRRFVSPMPLNSASLTGASVLDEMARAVWAERERQLNSTGSAGPAEEDDPRPVSAGPAEEDDPLTGLGIHELLPQRKGRRGSVLRRRLPALDELALPD